MIQNITKLLIVSSVLATLTACDTLGPERPMSRVEEHHSNMVLSEGAWQSLNVIDTLQTLQIAKNLNCYHESDLVTKRLIGERPSQGKAIGIGIIYGVSHLLISRWLESNDNPDENGDYSSGWHIANIGWQTLSLLDKTVAVGNNFRIGLTPFGAKCP